MLIDMKESRRRNEELGVFMYEDAQVKLLKALRSGQLTKIRQGLRSDKHEGHCCVMGAIIYTHDDGWSDDWLPSRSDGLMTYLGRAYNAPKEILQWAGEGLALARFYVEDGKGGRITLCGLASLNDDQNFSFEEMADAIEACIPTRPREE